MIRNKRILNTLLLALGCAQSALAMDVPGSSSQQNLNSQLFRAITEHMVDEVQKLLENGANANATMGTHKPTALMLAVQREHEPICRLLLQYGADVNAQDRRGETPMSILKPKIVKDKYVNRTSTLLCKLLMEYGAKATQAELDELQEKLNEELLWAVPHQIAEIQRLIAPRENENAQKANKCRDLVVWDIQNEHKPLCKFPIHYKANIEARDANGRSALMKAASNGHEDAFKLLLELGANIHAPATDGTTALMCAAAGGNVKICELLIEQGANVNAQNTTGATALICAALAGRRQICWVLIKNEANINSQTLTGETALICVANLGYNYICKLLIESGANVNIQTSMGATALAMATLRGHEQICKTIITYAHSHPYPIHTKIREAQKRVHTARLALIRACPNLPRDVRDLIFMIDPELRQDFCSSISHIHKNKHNRAPFMPTGLIGYLIEIGILKPNETVKAIKAHHCKCLQPLMLLALPLAETDEMKMLLNPDNLDANFGDEIKQNIERRLGLPETDEISDADAVLALQLQGQGN